jgi:hypothetical protein
MSQVRKCLLLFLILAGASIPLQAQEDPLDPATYIGMELGVLLNRYGIPQAVYAVRGIEEWQDDVVFLYNEGDFYILGDRVWQIGIKSAYRISIGDPGSAVHLSFGEALVTGRDYAIFPLRGQNWPMALRFNFDTSGRVSAIFIYRTDL